MALSPRRLCDLKTDVCLVAVPAEGDPTSLIMMLSSSILNLFYCRFTMRMAEPSLLLSCRLRIISGFVGMLFRLYDPALLRSLKAILL